VRAYLQMALDLLDICATETEDTAATQTVDAVALIDQGADLHPKNKYGWMPLHLACVNCHAEVVKALLQKSADVDAKDSDGHTPLLWAYRK